jgi:CRISPR type III-A-associated protein Csm2
MNRRAPKTRKSNERIIEKVLEMLRQKYDRDFNIVEKFFSGENRAEVIKNDLLKFVETMASEEELVKQWLKSENVNFNYKYKITQSQLRKHYNYFLDIYQDVVSIRRELKELNDNHKVKLAMGKVYANYDFAREKINYFFKRFVEDLIDRVENFESLENAKVLFEALVGYSKVFLKS